MTSEQQASERAAALDCLRRGQRFALMLHVRPDGDSIGSSLALGLALRRLGKTAVLVRADDLPANLLFLPGIEEFVHYSEVGGEFDAAVFLDCGDLDRIGPAKILVERARRLVNIDHHPSNQRFGDVNVIEPRAAAAGEVAHALIRELGVSLDFPIACALYVALITDTGSFRYENTSAATHEIAAELLRAGVKPAEVARAVWEDRSLSSLRLLQAALAALEVSGDGRLAWTTLTREDFQRAGAHSLESEGIVNYPRTLRGVEIAALFLEEAPGEVKVSLRSNRRVDVSLIASHFGGGGHARAAGCTIRAPLAEARELVLARAREALGGGRAAG